MTRMTPSKTSRGNSEWAAKDSSQAFDLGNENQTSLWNTNFSGRLVGDASVIHVVGPSRRQSRISKSEDDFDLRRSDEASGKLCPVLNSPIIYHDGDDEYHSKILPINLSPSPKNQNLKWAICQTVLASVSGKICSFQLLRSNTIPRTQKLAES